ncbi:MAG: hypothetical protein A3I06_07760 [Candidatus Lindowbacteria bacterium RIFCSPLOWO2_02_FULL_62_12]|nr:MAG: hypothetical protein A3I06_07760 [Candidatus Lindowbacteria bacterium RIFCSPLOWO2_02_FULL_62_12]
MAVGLPMIIHHALPGQERHNLEYVRKLDLAEIGSSPVDVVSRLRDMLLDPARRVRTGLRLKAHSHPNAAFTIADHLLRRLPALPSPDLFPTLCASHSH